MRHFCDSLLFSPQDGLNVDAELEVDLQHLSGRLLQADLVAVSLARHNVGNHLMDVWLLDAAVLKFTAKNY